MSRQTTLGRFGFKKSIYHRNTLMETKVPDFVKLKTYNRIVLQIFNTKYIIISFQNLSFRFIFKIFLKFRNSYKKKTSTVFIRLSALGAY